MILCSKLKDGVYKIVTQSQVVTKFNVTKSKLTCTLTKFVFFSICLGDNEIGKEKGTDIIRVKVNPKFYRPTEVEQLLGDPSKVTISTFLSGGFSFLGFGKSREYSKYC